MDEELIELLRSGDETALVLFRQRCGAPIRYIIDAVLPDARDAEERLNDVYLKIISSARRKRDGETTLDENISATAAPEDDLLRRDRAAEGRLYRMKRRFRDMLGGERDG